MSHLFWQWLGHILDRKKMLVSVILILPVFYGCFEQSWTFSLCIHCKTKKNKRFSDLKKIELCWRPILVIFIIHKVMFFYITAQYRQNRSTFLLSSEMNWIFTTNSYFISPIYLRPKVIDLEYFKLWINLHQIIYA